MRASTLAPTCILQTSARGGQKYEYVFKKSQAVFFAIAQAGRYYFAVKFKRYWNSVDNANWVLKFVIIVMIIIMTVLL